MVKAKRELTSCQNSPLHGRKFSVSHYTVRLFVRLGYFCNADSVNGLLNCWLV
jgi:hypothetical protein